MKTEKQNCEKVRRKRKFGSTITGESNTKMAESVIKDEKKYDIDESLTSHGPSRLVAVHLNKQLPKAKENEQDPIPSDDDEDEFPEVNLDPEVIKKRKEQRQREIDAKKTRSNAI